MTAPNTDFAEGPLAEFRRSLNCQDPRAAIAAALIGDGAPLDGPFGRKPLFYADYVASGRALRQVEDFIAERVLPFYANTHTDSSWCGAWTTGLREEARAAIARCCGADERYAVIFAGSGATAGLNRLVSLLGAKDETRPSSRLTAGLRALFRPRVRVIIGPYEHHSNILPWRESGADVVEIGEAPEGGPDVAELKRLLAASRGFSRVICAFSAASNVTGITADVHGITRIVKQAGALMVWDYAGGAPYLPIDMAPSANCEIDAVITSPHKFVGGPGASGVFIIRRDAVAMDRPVMPGGGTVKFVSPTAHDYLDSLEDREEAGTPNSVADIRAALAFLVKDAVDPEDQARRNRELAAAAINRWREVAGLRLLGNLDAPRLPIISFMVRDGQGGYFNPLVVTRFLSDRFGIQVRGGCACAGPYGHRLLEIGPEFSELLRKQIVAGDITNKPGFVRLNFSIYMNAEKVRFLLDTIAALPQLTRKHAPLYVMEDGKVISPSSQAVDDFGGADCAMMASVS